ncbi:MAG TPA: phosphatase [Lacunisphaera sp.]|nr:phosphatase [Lacunisphaera sp.]
MSPVAAQSRSVAVVDIGSNSIKVLVAARDASGAIRELKSRTLEARISAGIGAEKPKLTEEGIRRGLGAIRELLMEAEPYRPARTVLVATSAVRDAVNGAEFCARVKAAVKLDIRILSGTEEANAIGRGLTCDRALADLHDFYLFDLGGGSLECLSFKNRIVRQALSLQLGCVRLTEKFVTDPGAPFPAAARTAVIGHVKHVLSEAEFKFDLAGAAGVAMGGTVSTARAIVGAGAGKRAEQVSPVIPVTLVERLLDHVGVLPLVDRQRVPGLPPARADVFPAALATLLALAEASGLREFRHSFHNLRWGLAAELLDA